VQSGTAVSVLYLTENHGVAGSNPGPAVSKSPANGGKEGPLAVSPVPFVNGMSTAGLGKGIF
jgi:hypothetical protein